MRIRTAIIGIVLLGQLSCSKDAFDINSFRDDSSITTLNGTWKVISFENYIDNKVEFKNQENSRGYDIVITFDDTKDPHELSGTNTTNIILGKFDYIQSRKFKVENLATTDVAQPKWADEFTKAILDGDATFRINTTGLRIYYDNKTKSVTLTRL